MDARELYAEDVAGVLQLEELDRNLYRGRNGVTARGHAALYGGRWPRKVMGIRGLYDGAMRDRGGRLLATVAQEHLLIHTMPPTAPATEG